jgi:hypothetical protein
MTELGAACTASWCGERDGVNASRADGSWPPYPSGDDTKRADRSSSAHAGCPCSLMPTCGSVSLAGPTDSNAPRMYRESR